MSNNWTILDYETSIYKVIKYFFTFFQTSAFLFVRRRGHVGVDGRDEGLDRRLKAKLHCDLSAQRHLRDAGRVRSLSHRLRLPGKHLTQYRNVLTKRFALAKGYVKSKTWLLRCSLYFCLHWHWCLAQMTKKTGINKIWNVTWTHSVIN